MLQRRTICAVVALLILPAILTAGSDIPMGHKDFYPTEDRPVGFRGDGNGYFPGATPVKVFSSGTPKKVEQKYKDKHGREKTGDYIDIVDDKPRNVVWKTEMPSWANSQPIVVGDRVFTIGEPDWLICADARTGKVLWAHRNSVWSTLLPDEAKAQKLDEMFQIYLSVNAMIEGQFKDRKPRYSPSEFRKTRNLYVDKCIPRNLNALASLDPEVDYKPSMQKMIEGMDLFI
ncbi:MAG: PQQ-binding-like beta-propeller repeat protein, partial [Phycisphaerae bacterium]